MGDQEKEIRRLEYLAQSNPRLWKWRVGFWVALGYGVLALFPLSLLTLIGTTMLWAWSQGCLCVQAANPAVLLGVLALFSALGLALSAFVVRLSPPPGIPLRSADAPELFAEIRNLSKQLHMRPFTRVLLTPDGGAGVVELPRAWGGTVSYLLIGLPLLETLSMEQFRAVLTHELGHLRGGDSRFTRATVRLSAIWERLYGRGGGRAFRKFAGWYFPRLAAHTYAVRRNHERLADRLAAHVCGKEALADALGAALGRLQFLDEAFQAALEQHARAVPHPPEKLFTAYLTTLSAPLSDAEKKQALRAAMGEASAPTDPHPSLIERMEALGCSARIPARSDISAAQALLGPSRIRLTETMDALWRKQLTPDWRRTFTETRAARRERTLLEEKLARGEWLDGATLLRLAGYVELFDGPDAARPYFERLRMHPEAGARAIFALGRQDLEAGRPDGLWRMENVLQRVPEQAAEGLQLLYRFHRNRGDWRAAADVLRRQQSWQSAPLARPEPQERFDKEACMIR
ncbi:MAG: M48 family metallopeptidase [Armatimonas sp.]